MAGYIAGKEYKNGNLNGEKGTDIIVETDPLSFYKSNGQLKKYNTETHTEESLNSPSF